jgi:hypothetical protein
MKKELAELLIKHNDDLMVSNNYVGRNTNKPTCAVSGTFSDFMKSFSTILERTVEEGMNCFDDDDKEVLHEKVCNISQAMSLLRCDTIGIDLIFY